MKIFLHRILNIIPLRTVKIYTFRDSREPYPSPGSASVAAALPASPSDAIFRINENKKASRDRWWETTSGLMIDLEEYVSSVQQRPPHV